MTGTILLLVAIVWGAIFYWNFIRPARARDKVKAIIISIVVMIGFAAYCYNTRAPRISSPSPSPVSKVEDKSVITPAPAPPPTPTRREVQPKTKMSGREFEDRFLAVLGIADLGDAECGTTSKGNETLTYPLDSEGTLSLTEYVTPQDGLLSVKIRISPIRQDSLAAGVIFYNAAIQAYDSATSANDVFRALGLDETITKTLTESRKTVRGDTSYAKTYHDKTIILSIDAE